MRDAGAELIEGMEAGAWATDSLDVAIRQHNVTGTISKFRFILTGQPNCFRRQGCDH